MKHRILLYSLCVAAVISCTSIKENRSVCPCLCSIDFTQVDPSINMLHIWFFDYKGALIRRDSLYSREYGNRYELEIERGPVYYYVWGNVTNNTVINGDSTLNTSLVKVKDRQADMLYCYKKRLDTEGEHKYDAVVMHKEHAVIDVVILDVNAVDTPLKVEIAGSTSGQYIDGRFIEDTVKTVSDSFHLDDNNSVYKFTIMRQSSLDDLKMSVITTVENQKFAMEGLPLGRWLKNMGYSMKDIDLSDISVEVDISKSVVSIVINDWIMTEPVKIVL